MQFFPLAIGAVSWFYYQEGQNDLPIPTTRRRGAIAIAIFGVLVSYVALFFFSSWLAHLASIVLTFAWGVGRFANLTWLRNLGICGLLAVTLPPPFNLDRLIVRGLQSLSTTISSQLIDITNVPHLRSGNVIELPYQSLFVEEACSGVDSQYALMAVAGTLLLVGNAGLGVSLLTIVTVPIWAILGNLLRIYSIVLGLEFFGVDLSFGFQHTCLGLVTFSLAAWAHWSSVQFLNYFACLWSPAQQTKNRAATTSNSSPKELILRRWLVLPSLMFVMTPMVFFSFQTQESRLPKITLEIDQLLPAAHDLPQTMIGSMRQSFATEDRDGSSILGLHSRVWTFGRREVTQYISLDLPFRGWHSLWECYEASGWTNLGTIEIKNSSDGGKLDTPYFETSLCNSDGSYALLQFSLFDVRGNVFDYDSKSVFESMVSRLKRSVLHRGMEILVGEENPITFQVQLLSRSVNAPTEDERQTYQKQFLEARSILREKSLPAFRALLEPKRKPME